MADQVPGLTGTALSPLSISGMPIKELEALMGSNPGMFDVAQETSGASHFWSTWPRDFRDPTRDVLDLGLGSTRIMNRVRFQASQFPCTIKIEFYDIITQTWKPVLEENSSRQAQVVIVNSVPSIVKSGVTDEKKRHPQHVGAGHWMSVNLKVRPFVASRVRLVLSRNGTSVNAPRDLMGTLVPYSLGVRDFEVGYEITKRDDFEGLAMTGQDSSRLETLTTASDLLGSQTAFVVRETRASHVLAALRETSLDPEDRIQQGNIWKCEPQPISSAVVNFYVDLRDDEGASTVVDRLWLDPIHSGVSMRVYYSEHVPDELTDSLESDEFLSPYIASTGGSNVAIDDEGVYFGTPADAHLDIDNLGIQWDRQRPWWLGMNIQPQFVSDDAGVFVFFDTREVKIWYEDDTIKVRVFNETTIIDDFNFITNNQVRIVIAWDGSDVLIRVGPKMTRYQAASTFMVTEQTSLIRLGGQALDLEADPGNGNYRLRGLVLKQAEPDYDEIDLFMAGGTDFYQGWNPDALTDRSILRIHPTLRGKTLDTSPYGIVGGSPLGFYESVRWKPVNRDFKLERGYLDINPVRTKYLKFEFTNLAAEPYSAPSPTSVWVKQAPVPPSVPTRDLPRKYIDEIGRLALNIAGSGGSVNETLAKVKYFLDQRGLVAQKQGEYEDYTPTEALYSLSPEVQERLRSLNPAFGMIPWNQGTPATGFTGEGVHYYNESQVKQEARVAFFVGLKALKIFRGDYTAVEDAGSYLFDFFDNGNLTEEPSGWTFEPPQGLTIRADWVGSAAAKVSEVLESKQTVKGLQFASVQSPARQRLTDPEFTDPLLLRWDAYEGAQISISGDFNADLGSLLKVQRKPDGAYYQYLEEMGTWDDIEASMAGPDHPTWDEFAADPAIGAPSGGVQGTETIDLPTRGRVYASARVYAPTPLTSPLHIQIIGFGGEVLADEKTVPNPHQVVEWYATYTIGETGIDEEGLAWDDIEAYGDWEAVEDIGTWTDVSTGGAGFHSYDSQVTVRLYQEGASDDTFYVDSIAVYEDPIVWEFTNDDGTHWYPVYDIRNDPNGAFLFPEVGASDENQFRFRLIGARPDLHVSSLYLRPWYGTMPRGVPSNEPLNHGGPHENLYDQYPMVHDSPFFKAWNRPIPEDWWSSFRRAAPIRSLPPSPPTPPTNLRVIEEEDIPGPPTPPTIPVIGDTDSTDTTFEFEWTASTDLDGTVTGYEVSIDGVAIGTTLDLDYFRSGATPETDYVVRVRAIDNDGLMSDWSTPVTITTEATVVPPSGPIMLRPVLPFTNDGGDPASVTGTQPVLADDDDATYVESDENEFPYEFAIEPMVGYESGMEIRLFVRLSVTGDGTPIDAHGEVFIATSGGSANSADEIGGFSDGYSPFGFYIPKVDGTIHTLSIPLSMGAWSPNDQADIVAALEAGAFLDFNHMVNSNWDTAPVIKVYDAWIRIATPGSWNDVDLDTAFIMEPSPGFGSATHSGGNIVCSTSPTRAANVMYNGLTVDVTKYYEVEVTWGGIVHNDYTPPYGIGTPYGGPVMIRSTNDISSDLNAYDGSWYDLSYYPEWHIENDDPHPDVERFIVGPGLSEWDDAVADTPTLLGIHVETPYSEIITSMRWREI